MANTTLTPNTGTVRLTFYQSLALTLAGSLAFAGAAPQNNLRIQPGGAVSTITVPQSRGVNVAGGPSTFPASFLSLPSAGHAVIVIFLANGDRGVATVTDNQSDNQSNTYSRVVFKSDSGLGFPGFTHADAEVWWCPSIGAPTGTFTVTVTPNSPSDGANGSVGLIEAAGISSLVNQTGVAQDSAGANTSLTVTAGGANTSATALVVYGIVSSFDATNFAAPASGYTAVNQSNTNNDGSSTSGGYKLVSAVETSSASQTWSSASFAAGVLATFPAAVAPVGGISLAGNAPVVTIGKFNPAAGAITLSGVGPGMDLKIGAGAGSAAYTGVAPVLGAGVAPVMATGAVTLTGVAPALALGTITPSAGALTLSGAITTLVVPNRTVTPSAGALTLSGQVLNIPKTISGAVGAVALAGAAPALVFTQVLTPAGTGTLLIGGGVPVVGVNYVIPSGAVIMTTVGFLSPTIAASAGALSLNGGVPSVVASSRSVLPGVGALALAGTTVQLQLTVPSPPAADIVFGGLPPGVVGQINAFPPAGALALGPTTPGIKVGILSLPQTSSLNLQAAAPKLDRGLNVAVGALTLTGTAPTVSVSAILLPVTGSATYAGAAPAFTPGVSATPPAGTLAVTGVAPVLQPALVVTTAPVALAGASPVMNLEIAPLVGVVVDTGSVPTVNGRATLVPAAGVLALTPSVPVQGRYALPTATALTITGASATQGITAKPAAGTLALGGVAGLAQLSGLPLAQAGVVALVGIAPSLDRGIAPRAGALAFSSVLPKVNSLRTIFTGSGSVTFRSDPATIAQVGLIRPPTGALAFASDHFDFIHTGFAGPAVGSVGMEGQLPLVQATTNGFFIPDTADVVLIGQPAVNSLYDVDPFQTVTATGDSIYTVVIPG